ncbi:MAG: hypothetical protein WC799_06545 [Desulfobacteraceae bacterium]|jgi:hypothetical protein
MIRKVLFFLLLTTVLTVNAMAQDERKIPDLKGTWKATAQMHYKQHGHMNPKGNAAELVVVSQEAQVFHGYVSWNHKVSGKETFSGVIENDGATFYLVGHTEGIRIGKMDSPDSFTFYILIPGGKNPRAGLASFTRVK